MSNRKIFIIVAVILSLKLAHSYYISTQGQKEEKSQVQISFADTSERVIYDTGYTRTSSRNVVMGFYAGWRDTTPTRNTAIGYKALRQNYTVEDSSWFYGGGYGRWNVLMGLFAGYYLVEESYCVIVGSDSMARNLKGADMLWYVDYKDPVLVKYPVAHLLRMYEPKVGTEKDTKAARMELNLAIREIIRPLTIKYNNL